MEYYLGRELGKGSYSIVYEGTDGSGKNLAIKILDTSENSLTSDKLIQKRKALLHEVEVGKRLRHPLIVAPIDGGEDERGVYCVMPLFETNPLVPNLAKLFPVGTKLSRYKVSQIVTDISRALQHCHDQGVIHGDIKPNNILVGMNQELKLADFGLSVIVGQSDRVSKGPTHFASPEQNQGNLFPASDQYSLACIAFRYLTGVDLFDGNDKDEIRRQHQHEIPDLQNFGFDPELIRVLSRALSKSPAERFSSVIEFAQQLEAVLTK